jgi:hypothetical protein
MKSTDLVWSPKAPPMRDPPNFARPKECMEEVRRIEGSTRANMHRSGGILSHAFHLRWFCDPDFPQPNLSNMSRWLLKDHDIDLGPADLRMRIWPFDTFSPFGNKVRDWIEPFAPSTAYELSRAARFLLDKEPTLMDDTELADAKRTVIDPIVEACPYGTSVRDVFPKLAHLGVPQSGGAGGPKRGPPDDATLLDALARSQDGMVEGMFIPRRNRRPNRKVEQRWAAWYQEYCVNHDLDRDEAFRQIMELAMRHLPLEVMEPDAA